jgi:hypothetical protein
MVKHMLRTHEENNIKKIAHEEALWYSHVSHSKAIYPLVISYIAIEHI